MNQSFNIETAISNNEIYKVNDWLKQHIHIYGKTKTPKALLLLATGEKFNPDYYIKYLKNKFK